ncbi:MAG: ankyrin repeat domain-containing protein [Candidatus Micrarchaeota archaeon]|nr:ankyrin repeat domain-containing protein [Candidatus Micrarchaeota archaeon]
MLEKALPKDRRSSSPKPSFSGKKDLGEDRLDDRMKLLNQELLVATRGGWEEEAKDAIEKGADVNAKDNLGMTALMIASSKNMFHICTLLMENGANLEARDISGYTPLMHAAAEGHTEVCLRLIKKGADVNARNGNDWTALMLAAQQGRFGVCGLLVEMGAEVDAKNNVGVDAAEHAKLNGHDELWGYLSIVSLIGHEKGLEFRSNLNSCLSLQRK